MEVVLVVERKSFEPEVGLGLERRGQSVLYLRRGQNREVILGLWMRKWFDLILQLLKVVKRYGQD